jgi:hypothetical protein
MFLFSWIMSCYCSYLCRWEMNSIFLYKIFNFQMELRSFRLALNVCTFSHVQSSVNEPSAAWRHSKERRKITFKPDDFFFFFLHTHRVKPQEHTREEDMSVQSIIKKNRTNLKIWKSQENFLTSFFFVCRSSNDDGLCVCVVYYRKLVPFPNFGSQSSICENSIFVFPF